MALRGLETDYHIKLPKKAEVELSSKVQKIADQTGREITSDVIWKLFQKTFNQRSI